MSKTVLPSDFYQLISEEVMTAILTLNSKNECTFANKVAHDLLEFPLDFDISKFRIKDMFPNKVSDPATRAFSHDILERRGLTSEVVIQKMNKQNFIATLEAKTIDIHGEVHVLLMIQDITLQKKMQRELNEKQSAITQAYQDLIVQNKQLKELDLAKNKFIAVTTHELRTPLSAMVASAEILKLKLYDNVEQHDEFMNMIYDQGQHLLNLVNDILDFAKIQSNKMDYYIEEKSIFEIVVHEVHNLQSMAEAETVTLHLEKPNTPTVCFFDDVRIKQVITNLVNNAIKYNRKNGHVWVSLIENSDWVYIQIKDSGKGIAAEDQAKVFNEFETLGKVANHAKGTGLGLPISQRMIQAMGGDIKLQSEADKGSTFTVEIPKKQVLDPANYRKRPSSSDSGDLAA